MPKVKSEKRSEKAEEEKEVKETLKEEKEKTSNGWNNGKLFGTESNENTFQGGGFKDKEKAQETLRLLEGKDTTYQFQIINSMYNRAKVIYKRTTDKDKRKNLEESIEVFEEWIDDYKKKGRSKETFSYLPVETVEGYEPLAKHHGIKDMSFLQAFKEVDGDLKRLRNKKTPDDSTTWDVHRNRNLKAIDTKINENFLPLFETDGPLRSLPTKEHVELIMWGYSKEPTKVKKLMAEIEEKISK
ncbi:uncharacterized protein LOC128988007 [Macrosteles quadrilineatus]|uniref:uncharacterized protein LOC128988007 n=1 Tax=Macrosteles quadrilineatus TaxID=74068 RepID=UPI0023E2507C|nr:uncharacterized protein LOC128988007 [Macrosteles quadrilineatus]XP_054265159.1 uncharacterized protein LOC128988007 [Macrosteles quadrilineatus]